MTHQIYLTILEMTPPPLPRFPPWLNLNGHYCIDNLNDQSKLLTPDKNFAEKKVNM